MKDSFMKEALKQAQKAYAIEEIPVGCVIVKDNKIIAKGYNKKETTNNPCGHAEIITIQKACKKISEWRLENCEMYVTLEPCMMCVGAIIQSRIKKVYIGTLDKKTGAVISKIDVNNQYIVNHKFEYEVGILEDECSNILKDFFRILRKGKV
ncbi:MAG: tRNA adenosine(34) deaminase TadA [Clostridia bacterium]|nr:tRNA adenosine(34) deaminase TadA [Clostridia bacterium]